MHLFEYGCVISEHWDVGEASAPHLNALAARGQGNPHIRGAEHG
jgi:hypothetical protein